MFLPAICYFVALVTAERGFLPEEGSVGVSSKAENAA
jgi:hypothetical protein